MPAEIAVTDITRAGVWPNATAVDITSGNMFANDGRVFVHVTNTGTAGHTLTFITPITVSGLAVADHAVSIPAGGQLAIGPFPVDLFNQPAGPDVGKVYVNGSNAALQLRILRL